jgi:hypothetical protein
VWNAYRPVAAVVPAAFALAAFAGPTEARADTLIDGGELGGQVWTAEGSPYLVTEANGAPVVSAGSELRIEAGVTVRFSVSTGPALDVQGSLKVLGTPGSPVIFQGASDGVDVFWWGVLVRRQNGGASVEVTDAIFRNALYGVQVSASEAQISRTTFEYCRTGLSVTGYVRPSDRVYAFDSLTFLNNVLGFECDYCATVELTNVMARGNSFSALILHGWGSLTVANSTLDGGGNGNGLVLWPSTGENGRLSTVNAVNTIFSNNAIAIDAEAAFGPLSVTLSHSTFWGSKNANVRAQRSNASDPSLVDTPVSDVPTGVGNVVADPKYRSATDLRLTAGSPSIDSGTADGAPDHDLDQAVRPVDGDGVDGAEIDRGAYEFRIGSEAGGGEGGASGNDGAAGNDSRGTAGNDSDVAGSHSGNGGAEGGAGGTDRGAAGHGGNDAQGLAGSDAAGLGAGGGSTGGSVGISETGGKSKSAGGSSARGGSTGIGGGESTAAPTPSPSAEDRGGCGCLVSPRSHGAGFAPIAVLALAGILRRRRHRSARRASLGPSRSTQR